MTLTQPNKRNRKTQLYRLIETSWTQPEYRYLSPTLLKTSQKISRLVQEPDLRLDCNNSYATTTNKKKFYQRDQPHSYGRSTSIYFADNFVVFFFSIFLYKKAIRNLRKIWKQLENFTFNFRQNLFRESTSLNKEHKFLVQCHLKTGIHCFVASTEVGFSLQEDIGFNFLTKFWYQSSKFTLCLNLNHFFGLVFFGENIPMFSCCSGSHIFETQMPG